jgi:hypothetical protein
MATTLEDLRLLEKDWDSYGADKISESAITTAESFLKLFEALSFSPPAIVPTSDGGIALEWHTKSNSLEIFISAKGKLESFYISTNDKDYELE